VSVPTDNPTVQTANYDQEMIPVLEHSPLRHAPKSPLGIVVHPTDAKTPPHVIRAWPALTPLEREAGLQFCHSLEPNTGVLFVFPGEFFWPMWMRDTPLPLDIVFLRSRFHDDGTVALSIVDIQQGEPFSLTHLIPKSPCDMVFEMPAGSFGFSDNARRGVKYMTMSGYETALLRAIRVCPPAPPPQPEPNGDRRQSNKADDSLPPAIGEDQDFRW
jgi:uncharacterized membrane protein (UPF0127 family)